MGLLGLFAVLFIVIAIGGGVGYYFYIKTRPKKQTWNAKVYQLGDGVAEPLTNDKGVIVSDLKLRDLRPYASDILQKVEDEPGITSYELQKIKRCTPEPTQGSVEYWGENNKEVTVLLHKGECTLLKKGYDKTRGEIIFTPLPSSRINLIKAEVSRRKGRLNKEKDILTAITPWVVTGIAIMGLVGVSYVLGSSFVKVSDNIKDINAENNAFMSEKLDKMLLVEQLRSQTLTPESHNLGVQEQNVIRIEPNTVS